MASTLTTLLANIKANLEDSTNFSTLTTKLKGADITPVFFVTGRTTPWAVITPGATHVENDNLLCEHIQEVDVTVVTRRYQTQTCEVELVGNSTVTSIEEIVHEVRKALDRPSPYGDRKPTGASYTTQSNVPSVNYTGCDAPEIVEDYSLAPARKGAAANAGTFSLAVTMHFEYTFYDERL